MSVRIVGPLPDLDEESLALLHETIRQLEQRSEEEKARERAELRDFGERCEQLESMRAELTEKYPDRHVALTAGRALVVAGTMEELIAKIKELGERPGHAAHKFMNTRPRRQIL